MVEAFLAGGEFGRAGVDSLVGCWLFWVEGFFAGGSLVAGCWLFCVEGLFAGGELGWAGSVGGGAVFGALVWDGVADFCVPEGTVDLGLAVSKGIEDGDVVFAEPADADEEAAESVVAAVVGVPDEAGPDGMAEGGDSGLEGGSHGDSFLVCASYS